MKRESQMTGLSFTPKTSQRLRAGAGFALALTLLAGCVGGNDVTRASPLVDNAPLGARDLADAHSDSGLAALARASGWDVVRIDVVVPRSLSTSEANTMKPMVDLLWQEDPSNGDRHAQVAHLLHAPLDALMPAFEGTNPVILRVQVDRFHAQTPRVRATFGGEHEIEFRVSVHDAITGAPIYGPVPRDLTFAAFGGARAAEADRLGLTQKRRIQARMHDWLVSEFDLPVARSGLTF